MGKLSRYKRFALDHYLSYWPEGYALHELEGLFEGNNLEQAAISVWAPFEVFEISKVFDLIQEMADALERDFIERR